ncbi:MAG: glycosyltransferase family 2 protein, partial [Planctomycetes bacterium]|nr:glycosyltransferase family 2 protein [Planctomycetota bacterium]
RWMSEDYEPGLVSVIIPTYNRAQGVIASMDSVLAQSYRPLELVVVDDGSTDDTVARLEKWAARAAREDRFEFRYVSQDNRGAPAARNVGLHMSRGDLVVFIDADDLMAPDRISLQAQEMKRVSADMGTCSSRKQSPGGWVYRCPDGEDDPLLAVLSGQMTGVTFDWMFSRDILMRVNGWEESLICYQDYDLVLRCLVLRPRVAFSPEAFSIVAVPREVSVCHSKHTAAGLASILTVLCRVDRLVSRWSSRSLYAQGIAGQLLTWAVTGHADGLHEAAGKLEREALRIFPSACWGDSALKRMLYRFGKARLCGMAMRLKWKITRTQ